MYDDKLDRHTSFFRRIPIILDSASERYIQFVQSIPRALESPIALLAFVKTMASLGIGSAHMQITMNCCAILDSGIFSD